MVSRHFPSGYGPQKKRWVPLGAFPLGVACENHGALQDEWLLVGWNTSTSGLLMKMVIKIVIGRGES